MPQKTSCSRCCCQQCCRVFWSYGMRVPPVPAQFLCVFLSFYCIRNLVCFIATEFISGATIGISDTEPWSVVIVTEVMECLHSFLTCKEMIYVILQADVRQHQVASQYYFQLSKLELCCQLYQYTQCKPWKGIRAHSNYKKEASQSVLVDLEKK